MKILCFVFSWKGQYENAVNLEKQLSKLGMDVVVINSEDNIEKSNWNWVDIGDDCYFSDQFRKCLDIFNNSDADFLWHIQADASYDNWEQVLDAAKNAYEKHNWGVFAPNVDDTFYVSERTDVFNLDDELRVVATTDNTCWFISKDIIKDLCDNISLMDNNHLGWGWDLLVCAFAHMKGKHVIRDYSITIDHPKSTGYMKETAEKEMIEMFNKCPDNLKQAIYFIKQSPRQLARYHNKEIVSNRLVSEFVYDTEVR